MKTIVLVACVISAIAVFFPGNSTAEPTHPNEIGLYAEPHGYGATGTDVVYEPVDVYLVLTKPTDTETGLPYNTINFFDCRLNFNPSPSNILFKVGEVFPGPSINIGDSWSLHEGYLEYIVGFVEDIPVFDETVVLVTMTFIYASTGVMEVTLAPPHIPAIPGQMAFQSVQGDLRVMHPVSGSHNAPVFLFNGEAVPVENESFGSVKALFR